MRFDGKKPIEFSDETVELEQDNLEEETKYKLKLDAPKSEPAFGASDDEESLDAFADAEGDEEVDLSFGDEKEDNGGDEKPFDDEPFDAGVEADEDEDPEKFIQQLAGKLGTSLRKYNDERGEPDFDLEKYAINSVISATHTAEMDEEDQKDIIKKIKMSGADDKNDDIDKDLDTEEPSSEEDGFGDESSVDSGEEEGFSVEELEEGLWDNIHAKRERGEAPAKPGDDDYPKKDAWEKAQQSESLTENGDESNNYMFWQNLKTISNSVDELLNMDYEKVDALLSDGHGWALDHLATSADDVVEVYHFIDANIDGYDGDTQPGYEDEYGSVESVEMNEGKNDDKPLNKPMKGDVKKFKVYVKNDKGNVVKVEFGDPKMEIRRDNDEARKSFRARHKCSEKKDKTTAGYWSCKMWSNKKVSDITENLDNSEKNPIFEENFDMRDVILHKLHETTQPAPVRENPVVVPEREKSPSPRRRRIWETKPSVRPNPKMEENVDVMMLNGKEVDSTSLEIEGVDSRDYPDFTDTYFSYGLFSDGTEMSDEELDQLSDEYPEVLKEKAYESLI